MRVQNNGRERWGINRGRRLYGAGSEWPRARAGTRKAAAAQAGHGFPGPPPPPSARTPPAVLPESFVVHPYFLKLQNILNISGRPSSPLTLLIGWQVLFYNTKLCLFSLRHILPVLAHSPAPTGAWSYLTGQKRGVGPKSLSAPPPPPPLP